MSSKTFFEFPLRIIVHLHSEIDRDVPTETSLSFNARLDAIEGAPLPTSSSLLHHLEELELIDDFDDRS